MRKLIKLVCCLATTVLFAQTNNLDSQLYNISNYAYYGSIEDLGEINITRNSNDIVSGNFKGKFVRYDNPNEFISIVDGRFDIGPGLHTKSFP